MRVFEGNVFQFKNGEMFRYDPFKVCVQAKNIFFGQTAFINALENNGVYYFSDKDRIYFEKFSNIRYQFVIHIDHNKDHFILITLNTNSADVHHATIFTYDIDGVERQMTAWVDSRLGDYSLMVKWDELSFYHDFIVTFAHGVLNNYDTVFFEMSEVKEDSNGLFVNGFRIVDYYGNDVLKLVYNPAA